MNSTNKFVNHIKQFDDYYSNNPRQFWLDGVDDYWVRKAYNDRNKRICEIVDELNPESILDIGCGTGDLILLLRNSNRKITGVEPSDVNANKCEGNIGDYVFRQPAEKLLCKDNTFNVVVMADVIEHVVDARKALQEALRVLKVGGHLILTTPNKIADILWSFGSKRMFNKSQVKDSLFTMGKLDDLVITSVYYDLVDYEVDCEHYVEGVYPRSRILSWLFNPNSRLMMGILSWLGKFVFLRYRQILVIRKIKSCKL